MVWLLAQATTPVADPISGGAGWVGAGLLGLVVSWLLLKHLPDLMKQMKDLQTDHNALTDKIHTECARERKEQFGYFSEALNKILERHREDTEPFRDELQALRTSIETLGKAVDALRKGQQ